ncbi:MAG: 6-phosphofructokinase [Clostridiales bacterium GWC2_40_7]|nr:MAG: 6-phosphofructokinase [Clostridiales bacterium GWC2_40_7]
MSKTLEGNLLIAQGGGPTAVINASLQGVVEEAKKHSQVKGLYGALYGVEGVLKENFINLGREPASKIKMLSHTPASALGSCRRKLVEKDFPIVLEILKRYDIRYFLYNGGNDSMDTCNKISLLAGEYGYDLNVIGVPKTIDNDIALTDHCPGFGSAARYAAVSAMELAKDVESLPIHVCIMELMGRNAGWLTASATLAKKEDQTGPHLIYLPERPFIEEEFLEDVKVLHKEVKGVLVVVSEGLADTYGNLLADSGIVDGFRHKIPGGVSQYLSNLVMNKLGIKSRSEKPGLLGRASIAMQSYIDREEAKGVGSYAVKKAVEGKSGYMVSIKRMSDKPYRSDFELVPLEKVANEERKFPMEWINKRGNGIKKTFIDYCMPLVGESLPEYVSLDKIPVI